MRHDFNNGRVIVEHVKRRPMTNAPAPAERRREAAEAVQASAPPARPTLRLFPGSSEPPPAQLLQERRISSVPIGFETALEAALRHWETNKLARK